jgi:hypothetical protein
LQTTNDTGTPELDPIIKRATTNFAVEREFRHALRRKLTEEGHGAISRLAQMANVSRAHLSNYIAGRSRMNERAAEAVTRYMRSEQ